MWGFKWEKEINWTHICKWANSCCSNSCLCRKSRIMWGTESSDQVLGRKRLTLKLNQCFVSVQRLSMVKNRLLDQKHMAQWRNITKDKTFLISNLYSCSSLYSCLNISFKMFKFIFFELFLLKIKKFKINFTAAEKQPIVSSKQPIVLCLTALWRNQFNSFFEFLSVADQIKERILGQWTCAETWSRSERGYNSHKGIYSTILKI